MSQANEPKITIVTGGRQAGKTTFCKKKIDEARSSGLDVAGILSPAEFENGEKISFYTENLRSGERRLTGTNRAGVDLGARYYRWSLDPAIFDWANQFLREISSCDLLIIDELGPIEFEEKGGFTEAIPCLRRARFQRAYVVIRNECIANFRDFNLPFEVIEISHGEVMRDGGNPLFPNLAHDQ